MGTGPRVKPERLAEKLRRVREALGLSQAEMWRRLGVEQIIVVKQISAYELGKREPPLMVLLAYARAANVIADVLIDDELDLPANMPTAKKHEGVRRRRR
jgi:transcriptional regulator with XRE-family HTH domain